mmetsp:Transcript_70472/g.187671  ORF Transcript_70472/g.187671 Transcript_70472/m.187671 type:complete len:273 (+) Transcript_70472:275-1093(+)
MQSSAWSLRESWTARSAPRRRRGATPTMQRRDWRSGSGMSRPCSTRRRPPAAGTPSPQPRKPPPPPAPARWASSSATRRPSCSGKLTNSPSCARRGWRRRTSSVASRLRTRSGRRPVTGAWRRRPGRHSRRSGPRRPGRRTSRGGCGRRRRQPGSRRTGSRRWRRPWQRRRGGERRWRSGCRVTPRTAPAGPLIPVICGSWTRTSSSSPGWKGICARPEMKRKICVGSWSDFLQRIGCCWTERADRLPVASMCLRCGRGFSPASLAFGKCSS